MSSSLTETQDKVLSILPCFTSCLSCLGSAQIIYKVLTSRRSTPYRRILLGLSSSDFLCSIIFPLQAFLLPADTSDRVWAVGNDRTCTFLGFGQQIIFASIFYNSMLSLYFLLTVRFGFSNEKVRKTYEPWMHALSIGYPLVTAIIGVALGLFQELELDHGCWVVDNEPAAFFFGYLPTIVAFSLILGNNLLVYWHVRTTIQKSIRRFQGNYGEESEETNSSSKRYLQKSKLFLSSMGGFRRTSAETGQTHRPNRSAVTAPQAQRVRAVATQAFWYVAAFLITYLPTAILRIYTHLGWDDEQKLFPLLVIQALFLPSQGFFNVLVYLRPTFWRTRREYPQESVGWALRRALYGDHIPPTKELNESNERRRRVRRTGSSSDFDFGEMVHRGEENNNETSQESPAPRTTILQTLDLQDKYPETYWDDYDNKQKSNDNAAVEQEEGATLAIGRGPEHLATTETLPVAIDEEVVETPSNEGVEVSFYMEEAVEAASEEASSAAVANVNATGECDENPPRSSDETVVAIFRNESKDPTMENAELYWEHSRYGPLGHGDPPLTAHTFPGHRWFIVVNGIYTKEFTIMDPNDDDAEQSSQQQVFTI